MKKIKTRLNLIGMLLLLTACIETFNQPYLIDEEWQKKTSEAIQEIDKDCDNLTYAKRCIYFIRKQNIRVWLLDKLKKITSSSGEKVRIIEHYGGDTPTYTAFVYFVSDGSYHMFNYSSDMESSTVLSLDKLKPFEWSIYLELLNWEENKQPIFKCEDGTFVKFYYSGVLK